MTNNRNKTTPKGPEKAKTICKLGLDTHAASIMVARQLDGSNPQPARRFSPKALLSWVEGQLQQGYEVISCYEAGPTGYWLHRRLEHMGVTHYVICPTRLDSRSKGVNTDKTDALELLVRLDRYVAGNQKAFSVVRVPTEAQEQRRALCRQRDQLRRKRLSLAAQGRMLLLGQGYRRSNRWWQAAHWDKLEEVLPQWLIEQLEVHRQVIQGVDAQVRALTRRIADRAPQSLPRGMGALSHEVIEAEIKDWNYFANRRQVGSYAGLTGGVSSSGEQRADLSLTKAGNRRLSSCLIECAWRMLYYQPDYWLVKTWRRVLLDVRVHARRRKQAIVAFARQLLIDVWKWKSGRATPQQLGWRMT